MSEVLPKMSAEYCGKCYQGFVVTGFTDQKPILLPCEHLFCYGCLKTCIAKREPNICFNPSCNYDWSDLSKSYLNRNCQLPVTQVETSAEHNYKKTTNDTVYPNPVDLKQTVLDNGNAAKQNKQPTHVLSNAVKTKQSASSNVNAAKQNKQPTKTKQNIFGKVNSAKQNKQQKHVLSNAVKTKQSVLSDVNSVKQNNQLTQENIDSNAMKNKQTVLDNDNSAKQSNHLTQQNVDSNAVKTKKTALDNDNADKQNEQLMYDMVVDFKQDLLDNANSTKQNKQLTQENVNVDLPAMETNQNLLTVVNTPVLTSENNQLDNNIASIALSSDNSGCQQTANDVGRIRELCKDHGCEIDFWCDTDGVLGCKMCIRLWHRNCQWVLLEEKLELLHLECQHRKKWFAGKSKTIQDEIQKISSKQYILRKLMNGLKDAKELIENHKVWLMSIQSEYNRHMESLEICYKSSVKNIHDIQTYEDSFFSKNMQNGSCGKMLKSKSTENDYNNLERFEIFKNVISITSELNKVCLLPEEPDIPLLQYAAMFEEAEMAEKAAKRARITFPDTLDGFGYEFKDGRLAQTDGGGGFNFNVRDGDQDYNQKHYEALGEVITEHIYHLLETEAGLTRLPVPAQPPGPGFVFATSDWDTNPRLMLLIHGSGVVRAGQWARRLIINDSLDTGTQLPYITRAVQRGYGVVVLNTNQNKVLIPNGSFEPVPDSSNPCQHAMTVWNDYISKAAAHNIAIVAHSFGGVVTTELFQRLPKAQFERVFAIAMTDSVHSMPSSTPQHYANFAKKCVNWVTSDKPLDTPVKKFSKDPVKCVSAGAMSHEMTSAASIDSVFEFFKERFPGAAGNKGGEQEGDEEDEFGSQEDGDGKDTKNNLGLPEDEKLGSSEHGKDNSSAQEDGKDNSGAQEDGKDNSGAQEDGKDNSGAQEDGNYNLDAQEGNQTKKPSFFKLNVKKTHGIKRF